MRLCRAQIVTLLRVADISGLCIEGPVFLDTRSEFMQNELTAMRTRNTLLRAKQSRAEHGLTAPFLRLVIARRLKLNTTFVMDNRRILTG